MNRQPFWNLKTRFVAIENTLHAALVRHGITALRVTVGMIFLGFGLLKFFPGVSPAENLAITTVDRLTFGLVPGGVGLVVIATLECFIGISLLANRWMRLAVWLLAVELVGVLAPIVLLTGRLFSGPHHAPTLEGQYVLKDVILVAAGMVIAAGTFRGGRLVRDEPQPARSTSPPETPHAGRQHPSHNTTSPTQRARAGAAPNQRRVSSQAIRPPSSSSSESSSSHV
jgi:putative oxidoreductase